MKPSNMAPCSSLRIVDGHNDVLLRLTMAGLEAQHFLERQGEGHLDLERAVEGQLGAGFFAILAPVSTSGNVLGRSQMLKTEGGYAIPMAPAVAHEVAREFALRALDLMDDIVEASAGRVRLIRDVQDLAAVLAKPDRLGAIMHFEGAEPIDADLRLLEYYYERGLRSVGPVWSRPNDFGHGVPFRFPSTPDTGPGLTRAGLQLVKACNAMGIVLDLAHLNEKGFWDVARHSRHPIVVSHAGCHALCPSARNLTDRQLDAIADSGGLVGINFFVADLRADGHFDETTTLGEIVRHIRHVAERVGVAHVAFGSDFDGARMPHAMRDCTKLPDLVALLAREGFSEADIAAITHGNWLRVLEATWH